MTFEATRIAFIETNMISRPETSNPPYPAEGADEIITQLRHDNYEIVFLHSHPLYHQESVERWLAKQGWLYAKPSMFTPYLVLGEPNEFMSLESGKWKVGIIAMLAATKKADEVVVIDRKTEHYHRFLRDHPDYTYYKQGEKRYPDYKVTLYENLADLPITSKNWGPKTESVPQD